MPNTKYKILNTWVVPVMVGLGLFLVIRPALAQTVDTTYPGTVGVESVDGYSQVYYEEGGSKKFITSGNINSKMPVLGGKYIAYVTDINGLGQVFLYDLTADVRTQLTFIGNNLNPKVDDKGRVVWEGWQGPNTTWQIFFFDGKSIRQLTTGDTSLNPDISGDYISYGRRDITDTWRAVVYSISDNKSVDVITGENARNPKIKNGDIYLAAGSLVEEKFSLTVDDLFLLNFTPISDSTESANIELPDTVLEELSATPSGVVEIPIATESGSESL